jgi:hypothetical protein
MSLGEWIRGEDRPRSQRPALRAVERSQGVSRQVRLRVRRAGVPAHSHGLTSELCRHEGFRRPRRVLARALRSPLT